MKTILAQTDIVWEDKAENRDRCRRSIENAAAQSADLLVFPEMTLTGFSMNTANSAEDAADSETFSFFAAMAREYHLALAYGFTEKGSPKAFNRFIIVNSTGKAIYQYSKLHPFSPAGEHQHFEKGRSLKTAAIGDISLTGFICYDLRFPEIFQAAADRVQLFIVMANWPAQRADHWRSLLNARAIETQSYVAGVNRVGTGGGIAYNGQSAIFSPTGELLADAKDRPGLISAEIHAPLVNSVREKYPFRRDRRTDLYIKLYQKDNS